MSDQQLDTALSLDYVIASVQTPSGNELAAHLEGSLGLRGVECRPIDSYKGYTNAAGLCLGGDRLVTVQWAPTRDPLVIAPGFISGKVATLLQDHYPHQCSRKDAAMDFTDEVAFDSIAAAAISMAKRRVIKTSCVGDWLIPGAPAGRTLYIHSVKSEVFIRIYEHSKLHGGDVTCRVEVVIRPCKKPGKLQLAALSAAGVLGLSRFACDLFESFGVSVERTHLATYVRQLSDLDQRLVRLWMQYGRTLDELLEREAGDIQALGAALIASRDILNDRRARASLAAARPKAVPLICL